MHKEDLGIPVGEGENDYDLIEVTAPGAAPQVNPEEQQGYEQIVNNTFNNVSELNEAIAVLKGKPLLKVHPYLNEDQINFLKMIIRTYEISDSLSEIDSAIAALKNAIHMVFLEMEKEGIEDED